MRKTLLSGILGAVIILSFDAARPAVNGTENPSRFYLQHNLVSGGAIDAAHVDPSLINSWGLAATSTSPWWIADNGTDLSTIYDGNGNKRTLTVSVPGAPTGLVSNGGSGFVVTSGGASGPALFIFATESGAILGWNAGVPPPPTSTQAILVFESGDGAIYKGLAIASTASGDFLYATDFHNGAVNVFDSSFKPVSVPGAFTDPTIPEGYAPFGIQNIKGVIVVTYAQQDENKEDDVPGMGHGFVNAFDTSGNLLGRLASRGTLNSPWGLALAPDGFGVFSGDLLVGNFGDGRIHAYDPDQRDGHGELLKRGALHSAEGKPIEIDGLWALQFGVGSANTGPANVLFFTAGPDDESHGLFGKLEAVSPPGRNR